MCGGLLFQLNSSANNYPQWHELSQERKEYLELISYQALLISWNPAQVADSVRLAIPKVDNPSEAYSISAVAKEKYGDYEGAIADYTKALELIKYNLPVQRHLLFGRGQAYASLGRYEEAVADYAEALRLFRGDYALAISHDQQTIQALFFKQAQAFEALGLLEEARNNYQAIVQLNPKNVAASAMLVKLEQRMKEG